MSSERTSFFSQPFSIQWRKALVSAPRLVPLAALKYTSAEGPHPFILNLPSRGKYTIPCYVFVPTRIEADKDAEGLPVLIDFHGGGFVLGSCLEQGPFCAKMARDLGAVVICVDYRMGPIDTFPAAIEDGEDVLSAVLDENAPGGKELRDAIEKRLTADEKKALRKARKLHKKTLKAQAKALRKQDRLDRKNNIDGGPLRPTLSNRISSSLKLRPSNSSLRQNLRPPLSRKTTDSSITSLSSLSRVATGSSLNGRAPTSAPAPSEPVSETASNASSDSLQVGPIPILDPSRVALSGFSSGGNLILNLALSIPAAPPLVQEAWPCRFPQSYPSKIPLLLYYPSFDCRQLPSERAKPKGLIEGGGFWSQANDLLMPTYLPRHLSAHPRASPGLAELKYGDQQGLGLHDKVRMQLVLPELDSLSEQSEIWVKKAAEQGRADHLIVERYKGMKHGWTQMPESWLNADERRTRLEAFENSVTLVRGIWEKTGEGFEDKEISAVGEKIAATVEEKFVISVSES